MHAQRAFIPANTDMAGFMAALDALGQRLAFMDCNGYLLFATGAMQHVLASGGPELKQQLKSLALGVCARMHNHSASTIAQKVALQEVTVGGRCHAVTASYIAFDLFGSGPTVVLSIDSRRADPLAAEYLRERFRLSKQESRVAQLLAGGLSNLQVAEELSISPHTARHHTQRIMQKMGASSRSVVVSRLLRGE